MKVYRSEYFWKKKQWFSDFKAENDNENTAENRINHDKKRFMAHTGLVKTVVNRMFDEAMGSELPKELWKEKFGWTMIDLGLIELFKENK